MRTVFSSNNEAAHIWASQSQNSGRAGNVFFENGVIYSYGRHFPVARFASEYAPSEHGYIVLFTNRGYSNSTGKHKSLIRRAIPNLYNVVYCDDPTRGVEHNLGVWRSTVERLRRDFAAKTHRMTRGNIAGEIFKTCESAILYCMALKIDAPEWTNETNDEMTARDYVYELAKARDAKKEAARIEREKLAAVDAGDRLAMWQAGQNPPQNGFQYCATVLRLNADQIQTSRGAQIPVADALKLWPLLLRVKQSGKTLEAGLHNINLGAYRFNSFDGATLIVGCHSIAWDQLEKMADELNLLEKA
jgi:hypothetical protein